jgi:DNA-directed RNA polymerase subunit RPC12/RpoP
MEGVLDLREKLAKLMYGRYGVDQLGRSMLIFALVLCVLSLFVPRRLSGIIYYISLILIILMYIRMFSKNIQKRYQENNKYLSLKASFLRKFQREKEIFSQRRFYHFYRCPRCRQRIRIPRGKGRIEIRCPKCSQTFIKKS